MTGLKANHVAIFTEPRTKVSGDDLIVEPLAVARGSAYVILNDKVK